MSESESRLPVEPPKHWVRITRSRLADPGQKYSGRHVIKLIEAVMRNPDGTETAIPLSCTRVSTDYPISDMAVVNLTVGKIEEILVDE